MGRDARVKPGGFTDDKAAYWQDRADRRDASQMQQRNLRFLASKIDSEAELDGYLANIDSVLLRDAIRQKLIPLLKFPV